MASPDSPPSPHEAIRALLAAYCRLCDDGRFDEFAQLFTDDAEFSVMGSTHTGRDAISTWMAAAQPPERRGKHLISEPGITLVDDTHATCRTDYAFVGHGSGERQLVVTSTGRYVDRLRRDDDGQWRFAARRIVFLGEDE
jgi:uncharacterized protein (TIGR02246 family)